MKNSPLESATTMQSQAQRAFQLWKIIDRLNRWLWKNYQNEFFDIIERDTIEKANQYRRKNQP